MSGGVLRPDDDANNGRYGRGATPSTILATREMSAPPEAAAFLSALKSTASAARATAIATHAAPPPPRRRPTPATDDDIRARVVDIQQSLDRLLADTTPAPVGTSGTSWRSERRKGSIAVDRARLMQLRQQLDALLATLNRAIEERSRLEATDHTEEREAEIDLLKECPSSCLRRNHSP